MSPRRLWWLAVVLVVSDVYADDSHCPCVSPEACSSSPGSDLQRKSNTSCKDPTTVHCCSEPSSTSTHNEPLQIVSKDLEQEQKFMKAIENLMEEIHVAVPAGENREDKSLEGTSKNSVGCDGKQCEIIPLSDNKENVHMPSSDRLEISKQSKDFSVSLKAEKPQTNSTEGDEEAKNKIIIVYAEKPNKNNTNEGKNPQIVYPSVDGMEEYLQSEETSIMTQKLAKKDNREENESLDKDDLEASRNQQSNARSNLKKLFPKRTPPLKSSQSQNKPDDLGEAGSEIEEVKTTAPSPAQTEQTLNRKPLRPLHRHLPSRTGTTDESTPTTGGFEPHRPTRGRISLTKSVQNDVAHSPLHQDPTAAIMDDINLKAINGMMKTNFSTRPTFPRRQRPMWHPQSRLQTTSGSTSNLPLSTQLEQRNLQQSITAQTGESSRLTEQSQGKTSENPQSIEYVTNTTATEVQGSRYITRRRNQFRNQNSNLPSKISATVSMSQEQVFDTLKDSKPQDASRRRSSYRRSQVKTQSGTTNADLAEQINSQSDPNFGKKRTKFRPHSKSDNTTPIKQKSEPADSTNAQSPESNSDNFNSPGRIQNNVNANPITPSEELPQSMETEGDLEGSGSEIKPQRVRMPGRFTAPQRMEKGFQPVVGPAELNVIGPVPAGFQDRARGFSNQELGFELPRSNLQPLFSEEQFQIESEEPTEKPLRVLPPAFPVAQPPTGISSTPLPPLPSTTLIDSYSDDDLLPPLDSPKPLSVTLERIKTKAAENSLLDQHRDVKQLNLEFNNLKTKYDMLLERYAESLKIYNEKYRDLIGSNVNKKK